MYFLLLYTLTIAIPGTNYSHLPVAFSKLPEFAIQKNQQLTELDYLGREYILSFDLQLSTVAGSTWQNILHLTLGGDNSVYGDRTPALWLKDSKLYVASAISGNKDKNKFINPPLQAGAWMHVEISQTLRSNKVRLIIC